MDTTAAAELGMGGIDDVGNWNGEGWQEQEYESFPTGKAAKFSRGTRTGEGNEPGLSASRGRTGSEQDRPPPSGPEPPQKRIRTTHGRQGTGYGNFQENGDYNEEVDDGDGQGLDYNAGQNFDSDDWYGAESGPELGYPGGADGGWYPSYGPGVGPQHQMADPCMMPNFYHDGMNYGSAGPMNFFGVSAPPSGAGLGNGRGNTSRIFYKTKLCSKFRAGTCTFDGNCNFAHGAAELRKPPPGWDSIPVAQNQNGWGRGQRTSSAPNQSHSRSQRGSSDFQKLHKTRPCKNYFTDGVCPYGDKCSFLHDVDGMQPRSNRDSTTWSGRVPGGGRRGGRGGSGSSRPFSWKTKMCRRWETTGECHFGDNCHFAHGAAGPKASLDMKAPFDGPSNTYEDWDEDNEWETQNPGGMEGQQIQSFNNNYSGNEFYPVESYGAQYFQQPQQNVPYYYMDNSHNVSGQSNSAKKIGVRVAAKNVNADYLHDEHDYYELETGGYQENFDLLQA
ncbi:hypothetical protein O6H91_01G044500 [Diphasiastrum complanatum]|uniref:Uncharacterized protein n=1 Tax=Diphasiastrum complanatum TaxID=34168 RepID=A0ACC2EQE4_DIPCM|nr:hypothetical protein O6H91_01G044500 [Diphasiastrum complanatum]